MGAANCAPTPIWKRVGWRRPQYVLEPSRASALHVEVSVYQELLALSRE